MTKEQKLKLKKELEGKSSVEQLEILNKHGLNFQKARLMGITK